MIKPRISLIFFLKKINMRKKIYPLKLINIIKMTISHMSIKHLKVINQTAIEIIFQKVQVETKLIN